MSRWSTSWCRRPSSSSIGRRVQALRVHAARTPCSGACGPTCSANRTTWTGTPFRAPQSRQVCSASHQERASASAGGPVTASSVHSRAVSPRYTAAEPARTRRRTPCLRASARTSGKAWPGSCGGEMDHGVRPGDRPLAGDRGASRVGEQPRQLFPEGRGAARDRDLGRRKPRFGRRRAAGRPAGGEGGEGQRPYRRDHLRQFGARVLLAQAARAQGVHHRLGHRRVGRGGGQPFDDGAGGEGREPDLPAHGGRQRGCVVLGERGVALVQHADPPQVAVGLQVFPACPVPDRAPGFPYW